MAALDLIDLYLAELRQRSCTDATIDTYSRHLLRADRELPKGLDIANRIEIKAWLWRGGLEPASRATYDSALRGFFVWAYENRKLTKNPMAELARPKVPEGVPRVAHDDEARWAVTEAPEPYRLWATLAAYQGLRCVEISRLHREHISEEVTAIHRGKGDKPRWVPTHQLVWTAVQGLPPGPIAELTPKQISDRFGKVCRRNGLKRLSMHWLRGWHATHSYDTDHDLIAVSLNLGHTKTDTTLRYVRRSADQRRAAIRGLPVFA